VSARTQSTGRSAGEDIVNIARKKLGRKPLSPGKVKNDMMFFRVDEMMREGIRAAAEKSGKKPSIWLRSIVAAAITAAISSCVLVPNSVRPEMEHDSHITEHSPIARAPMGYYVNKAQLALHWDMPGRLFMEIADGVSMGPCWTNRALAGCGEMLGPREEFSLRVGAVIQVRP